MPKRKKDNAEQNEIDVASHPKHTPTSNPEPLTTTFSIPYKDKQILCALYKTHDTNTSAPSLIFTHGAGGGISAPATSSFATGFSLHAPILCFQGSLNLTQRINFFNTVIDHQQKCPALGGRSMGARAAVLTREAEVQALVLVSYPLLAAGEKREYERREKILLDLEEHVDVLFVVGREDKQCDFLRLGEIRAEMKARSWLCVVRGADHGMGWKGTARMGEEGMRRRTGEVAAKWLESRDREKTECEIWWDGEREEVVCGEWRESGNDASKTKR
ncbi:hypothetical protein AC578_7433 [Pseudocercospora eumusae]|uniref:KANL3/Tex30 alpha/beta hydrolase-like domain-containing protein n=1 Tax=Pseudocercospora eumusae TaxID=321146 RepID=A0A139GY55_9PEZI|nr:hypothetical protein AC578_7433 [Pseudocercospora eumusae]